MKNGSTTACPNYFKANCYEASKDNRHGYFSAGYQLTIHLTELIDIEADAGALKELLTFLENEDGNKAMQWFRKYLPGCMQLVPHKRKTTFLKGVFEAYKDDRIDYLP